MRRLIKDLQINLTEAEKKFRNKVATEETIYKKYGVHNCFALKEIQEKVKATNQSRYGVDNIMQLAAYREKANETRLIKYGNMWYNNSDQQKLAFKNNNSVIKLLENTKKTNLERYGVEWFSQTSEHQQQLRNRYFYDNSYFDSFPELAVYIYYKDHQIAIYKNTTKKFKYIIDSKVHYYFPDFKIDNKWVEIKGGHFFKEDGTMCNPFDHTQDDLYEAKHKCMLENGVEIWTEDKYKFALKYLKDINFKPEIYKIQNK